MDKLEKRLTELKTELEKGQQLFQQKQQELTVLQQTILRIQGAIQVCEEMLKEAEVI
jgi:chromosome segregation ATPase